MEWSKLRQTVAGNSLAIQAGGDVTTGPVINVNANTIELKPGMDREAVAGVVAQVLSTMMQEVRANPKLMLHLLQGDTTTASASSVGDPFAHLRAQLAEARLDRESVRGFVRMAAALEHETRLTQAFGSDRIVCADGHCFYAYLGRGGLLGRSRGSSMMDFLVDDIPAFMVLAADGRDLPIAEGTAMEIDDILAFTLGRWSPSVNYVLLRKRVMEFLENPRIYLLSERANERGQERDEALSQLLYRLVKSHHAVNMRASERALRVDALDLHEIVMANRGRRTGDPYVSLASCSSRLCGTDLEAVLTPDYDRTLSPAQDVYGIAWRAYQERCGMPTGLSKLGLDADVCVRAEALLRNPAAWSRESDSLGAEQVLPILNDVTALLAAIEPFHHDVLARLGYEEFLVQKERDTLLRDLISGGIMLRDMLREMLWQTVERLPPASEGQQTSATG